MVGVTVDSPPRLFGRTGELEILGRLIANVRGGQSAVLVVRGEPGIGKTELLRHLIAEASGFRVARQLEAETRQLPESLDQPDAGQSAWLQTARLALPPPRMPADDRWASTDQGQMTAMRHVPLGGLGCSRLALGTMDDEDLRLHPCIKRSVRSDGNAN
jgi:AAA ATPase domain